MQLIVLLTSIGVLIAKKYCEKSKRSWLTFGLDSSKQVIGAGWVHVANLALSILISSNLPGRSDPCVWYFTNFVWDCTLGVFVEYMVFKLVLWLFATFCPDPDLESGQYRNEAGKFSLKRYAKQLAMWLFVVFCMKAFMSFMLTRTSLFYDVSENVLHAARGSPSLELFVVMIITPSIMNTVQFLLQDIILKHEDSPSKGPGIDSDEESRGDMLSEVTE